MRVSTLLAIVRTQKEVSRLLWVNSIGEETLKNMLIDIAASETKLTELKDAVMALDNAVALLVDGTT